MKTKEIQRNVFGRSFVIYGFCVCALSSCAIATAPALQPEINSLVVANRMNLAADKISAEQSDYGQGNYLLYYLDRGLVNYYAGRYQDSIKSFEKAKQRFEALYTQSISKEAVSWIVNDYTLPYRGSDYEYVLVNVFQAMNFLALNNPNEALVEARDMDAKYQVVEQLAEKVKKKHFEDNGFGRLFMGLMFEAAGGQQNLNDALISYQKSLALYRSYYGGKYIPKILKENLLSLAEYFGDEDYSALREDFRDVNYLTIEARAAKAEVIVIQLVGYSPLKVPEIIPIPLDRGLITKITFPKFAKRYYDTQLSRLIVDGGLAHAQRADMEVGADIQDIAIRDLESQKAVILSKAVLRPALKYLIERKQKEDIEKENGRVASEIFGLMSNLYNIYSEQADLRSWQALPAQIRVARLFLDSGQYRLRLEDFSEDGGGIKVNDLGSGEFKAGEKRFFVIRATR